MARVSDHVLQALAKAIAEAKQGSINAVAIVKILPTGEPKVVFAGDGDLLPMVNLGVDMLKATLMRQVVTADGAISAHSGLVVPPGHG